MQADPAPKLRLVVDTSSNVPPEALAAHDMIQVNTLVLFGDDQFELNRDIDIDSFLEMLAARPEHPTTSQPTPQQFQDAYRRAFDEGADEVLCIVVSSKLSGTFNSARVAAEAFPKDSVYVWDTRGASLSSGMHALEAATLAGQGWSRNVVLERLEALRDGSHAFFTTRSLEFLARSGRATNLQKNMANVLNLLPVLAVSDGLVVPVAKVRGRARAKRDMLNRIFRCLEDAECTVAVAHAEARDEAEELLAEMESRLNVRERHLARLDPALTALGGPGTLGLGGFRHAED